MSRLSYLRHEMLRFVGKSEQKAKKKRLLGSKGYEKTAIDLNEGQILDSEK